MDQQEMEILAIRYTNLAKLLRKNAWEFKDKEGLQLVRDAADAVFFDPTGKQTPQVVEQAFAMLKNQAMNRKLDNDLAAAVITALQRLVSQSGVYVAGRPSSRLPEPTGFNRLRAQGGHII